MRTREKLGLWKSFYRLSHILRRIMTKFLDIIGWFFAVFGAYVLGRILLGLPLLDNWFNLLMLFLSIILFAACLIYAFTEHKKSKKEIQERLRKESLFLIGITIFIALSSLFFIWILKMVIPLFLQAKFDNHDTYFILNTFFELIILLYKPNVVNLLKDFINKD